MKELPKSIDIDKDLELLRDFQKKKDSFKLKGTGDVPKDVYDLIQTKEYQEILDEEMKIENRIKKKLWNILMKYCDKGDFEGAKWFVGNSYKEMNTCGKVLLFRSILIRQDQNK